MPESVPPANSSQNDTLLGFDFGNKKIGIAVGHMTTASASPLLTLRTMKQQINWDAIGRIIHEWRPAGLVVGISLQQDGRDNVITPRIRKFCRQLEGRYHLPVYQMDEAYSTFEAKQLLYDELHMSAGKLWSLQDQLAAQLILQSWLNLNAPS